MNDLFQLAKTWVWVLTACLLPSAESWAAIFDVSVDPKGACAAVEVTGEIQPGDERRFVAAISEARSKAPLRRLYLNSQGGEFLAATAIWQAIRNSGVPVDTIVRPRHQCNSACVLLLAAGARIHVSSAATVIVHLARNVKTNEPSKIATLTMGYYLVESGFSRDVVNSLMSLKPGEDLLLTSSNARQFGFNRLKFYGSTDPPAVPGCGWKGFLSSDR